MTADTTLLLIGAFGIILPSLGFPSSTDDVLIRAIGIAVLVIGILLRRRGGVTIHASDTQGKDRKSLPPIPDRESKDEEVVM